VRLRRRRHPADALSTLVRDNAGAWLELQAAGAIRAGRPDDRHVVVARVRLPRDELDDEEWARPV